jgi:hypothetical protein
MGRAPDANPFNIVDIPEWERSASSAMTLFSLSQREFKRGAKISLEHEGKKRDMPVLYLASELGLYCMPPRVYQDEGNQNPHFQLTIPPAFIRAAMENLYPKWREQWNQLDTMPAELVAPGKKLEWNIQYGLVYKLARCLTSSENIMDQQLENAGKEANKPKLSDVFPLEQIKSHAAGAVRLVGNQQLIHRVPAVFKRERKNAIVAEQLAHILHSLIEGGKRATTIIAPEDRSSSPDLMFLAANGEHIALVGIQAKDQKTNVGSAALKQNRNDLEPIVSELERLMKEKQDERKLHVVSLVVGNTLGDLRDDTKEQMEKSPFVECLTTTEELFEN